MGCPDAVAQCAAKEVGPDFYPVVARAAEKTDTIRNPRARHPDTIFAGTGLYERVVEDGAIGKFKYVAGERGHHGLTGMVLSIGALLGKQPVATVQTAMSEITNQQVWDWCRSHLGPTVQSVRGRIRQALYPEQKQKPLLFETG